MRKFKKTPAGGDIVFEDPASVIIRYAGPVEQICCSCGAITTTGEACCECHRPICHACFVRLTATCPSCQRNLDEWLRHGAPRPGHDEGW